MTNEEKFEAVQSLVREFSTKVRLKLVQEEGISSWSDWAIIPSPGYFETSGLGPVRQAEVDWIELQLSVSTRLGRLIPDRVDDVSKQIKENLDHVGVPWTSVDDVLRIQFSEKSE